MQLPEMSLHLFFNVPEEPDCVSEATHKVLAHSEVIKVSPKLADCALSPMDGSGWDIWVITRAKFFCSVFALREWLYFPDRRAHLRENK